MIHFGDDDDSAVPDDDDASNDDDIAPDDDDAMPDDDDVAPDDDDAVPDDDDAMPDDDDMMPDDDDIAPDDDDAVPGTCEPAAVLSCDEPVLEGANFPPEATSSVLFYSCFDSEWTGPEFTYEFVAPQDGDYALHLEGFQGDLELFLLAGGGDCDPNECLDASVNAPDQPEEILFSADAGESFYVVVDGHQGAMSEYLISLTCPDTGDDDDAVDDDDTAPDDDDVVPDDDDTAPDDDDATPSDCPVFFVKGATAGHFELWTWNGSGFDTPIDLNPGGQGTVWGAVAGDFDGDGDLDALSNRGGNYRAHLWSSNCDGTFDETQVTNSGFTFPGGYEDVHGTADLDGDGDLDVYGWDYYSGAGVSWLNGGDGLSWTAVGGAFTLASWDPNDDGTHESVALGSYDLTEDGLPDLMECSNNTQAPTACTVHVGNGDGTFGAVPGTSLDQVVNGVAVGDFTGDGNPDVLGGLDDDWDPGQAWTWQNSSTSPTPFSGPGVEAFDLNAVDESGENQPGYGWMYPYDWDGDGDLDIVSTVLEDFNGSPMTLWYVENLTGTSVAGWGTPEEIGQTDSTTGAGSLVQNSMGMPVF